AHGTLPLRAIAPDSRRRTRPARAAVVPRATTLPVPAIAAAAAPIRRAGAAGGSSPDAASRSWRTSAPPRRRSHRASGAAESGCSSRRPRSELELESDRNRARIARRIAVLRIRQISARIVGRRGSFGVMAVAEIAALQPDAPGGNVVGEAQIEQIEAGVLHAVGVIHFVAAEMLPFQLGAETGQRRRRPAQRGVADPVGRAGNFITGIIETRARPIFSI